jgi:Holliday junction resolvase RusA-like endonuclease
MSGDGGGAIRLTRTAIDPPRTDAPEPVTIRFDVVGVPAPQGSKRAFVNGGRAIMTEASGPRQKAWRQAVAGAALDASVDHEPLDGPLEVVVVFRMPCPKGRIKKAPHWHAVAPDIDKLLRSTFDGLKDGGLMRDDRQFAALTARAFEVDGWTGATIIVRQMDPEPWGMVLWDG